MLTDRHESTADLDWLAFRYVAGELSDDERAAFELRLADDQTAREAVAAAVELSECVIAAGQQSIATNPHPALSQRERVRMRALSPPRRLFDQRERVCTQRLASSRSPSWLGAAGWLAASVAAMFLVMAMVESLRVERSVDSLTARGSSVSSRSLAAQWSDLRERATDIFDDRTPYADSAAAWHVDSNDIAPWHDPAGDESAEELLSPDWLIAALADEEMPAPDSPRVME